MIKNVILILGMHRSGTSALTRVMNLLGASLPKTLLGANEGNARGHWESQKIIDAHDAMLTELGSDWRDFRTLKDAIGTRKRKALIDAMADMIEAEYGASETVAIKEPRICRFTSLYLDAIASVGAKVHVIIPSRNPLEVMKSLKSRDGMDEQSALFLWLTHMLEAEHDSRNVSRSFVDYADFLDDPIKETKHLVKDMPFNTPHTVKAVEKQIIDFVNPDLKRAAAKLDDVNQHPIAKTWIAECYQAFLVLTTTPKSKTTLATLDRIRSAYYPAIDMIRLIQHDFTEKLAKKDNDLADSGDALVKLAKEHEAAWAMEKIKTDQQIKTLSDEFEARYHKEKDVAEAKFQAMRTDMTAQIDRQKSEFQAQFDTQKSEHETQINTLQSERAFMQNEFDAVISDLEKTVSDKEAALSAAYHELHAVQENLHAVLSSSSWRMTRGLRGVINKLRGAPSPTKALPEPQIAPRITDDR
ncbi:hypothetical protein [Fretibacter rubidus]|uniref:hypothetical protein n=1 Tax=Fretibacter rubidus TaxID=570162 RepID=UPI00352BAE67